METFYRGAEAHNSHTTVEMISTVDTQDKAIVDITKRPQLGGLCAKPTKHDCYDNNESVHRGDEFTI